MGKTVAEKRAAFRALHEKGCFVLPNPWDVGSARLFEQLGFTALASTSSGFAWSTGRPDYAVTCDDVLNHLTALADATDLPVNADFESGFATAPEGVATNVGRAVATGIAGLSIEDTDFDQPGRLYDLPLAVERIAAARAAIDASGADVLLVARTEIFFQDPQALTAAIDKLTAFAEAGADCLYAPGVTDKAAIAAIVAAVAPKPVNVLLMQPAMRLEELAELGVRRVSIGGALARVAYGAARKAAQDMLAGSFAGLAGATPGGQFNELFGRYS